MKALPRTQRGRDRGVADMLALLVGTIVVAAVPWLSIGLL